jgi:hypothetical protein
VASYIIRMDEVHDPEVQAAWISAYALLADTMRAAAEEETAKEALVEALLV